MKGGAGLQSHVRNVYKAIRQTQGKTLKRSQPGRRYLTKTLRFNRNLPANNQPKNLGLFNVSQVPNYRKLKRENKEYLSNLVQSRKGSHTRYSPGKNFPTRKQYLYQKFAEATQGRNNIGSMMRAIRIMDLSEEDRARLQQRVLNLYGNMNRPPPRNYTQYNEVTDVPSIDNW